MRITMMVGAAALLMLAQGVSGQDGEARLTIEGTSTVRSWTCEADGVGMVPEPTRGFEAVLDGRKALQTVTVSVPVEEIDCGNGTMDKHLRKALKSGAHPLITYTLATYELRSAEGLVSAASEGRLTIAGVERPIALDVSIERGTDGLRIRGEQQIRMTEYGVQPPRLMLGTLKVGDMVTVKFDMPLKAQPGIVAVTEPDRDIN